MSPSGIITIADTNLYNLKRCGKHDPKLTPSRMSITFPGNDIVVPLPLFSLASRLLSSSNRTKEERFVSDFAQWNEETTSNAVAQCYIKIEFIIVLIQNINGRKNRWEVIRKM